MGLIYITYGNAIPITIGVKRKVNNQVDVFSKYFGDVFLMQVAFGVAYLMYEGKIVEKSLAMDTESQFNCARSWIKKYKIGMAYIRFKYPLERELIDFLAESKESGIRCIVEFPNYPVETEIINKELLAEDYLNRPLLKNSLETVTTFAETPDIYGITAVVLQNGVNLKENKVRRVRKRSKEIHLCAVATMIRHHGYERIIKGLYNWYMEQQEYTILIKLVGEGKELENYNKLIHKYNLEEYISCEGKKTGKTLDEIYDWADIGISALGLYKVGYNSAAPIKTREYCSRGLPFIYGYDDLGFTGNETFVLKVSNDDQVININDVVSLYERTVEDKDIIISMRKKAENEFTWDIIMEPIINYFRSKNT